MPEILSLILKLPLEKIGELIVKVVQRRILLFGFLILFFTSSIGLLYWYYVRSSRYDDIVVTTLGATVEPTPQSYKGLESFLMSEVDQGLPESVKASQLSSEFLRDYSTLYTDLIKAQKLLRTDGTRSGDWAAAFPALDSSVTIPNLRYVGGQSRGEIFTDTQAKGFLFVPLDVIRNGPGLIGVSGFQSPEAVQKVNDLVEKDTEIKHDVILSRVLAADLESLLRTHVLDDHQSVQGLGKLPAQVYLLSGTGINRIFSNSIAGKNSSDEFYSTQFGHLTYFPGRPYFTGALALDSKALVREEGDGLLPQGRIQDYFYVSRPYMDLGGNGLVLTISRRLSAYQEHPLVLCMDFPISGGDKDLDSRLSNMLQGFNASTITTIFDIMPTGYVAKHSELSNSRLSSEQNSLISTEQDFIEKGQGQSSSVALADILGNIKRIDGGLQAGKLDVSVPLGVTVSGGVRSAKFLLFRLDLAGNRRTTELIGLAGCTCLALFSILLITFAATSASRSADLQAATRELNEAFEKVGTVLWDAPIPYALVGVDDVISDCNKAMAEFMGVGAEDLKGRKFRDLIADQYLTRYDGIEESRTKNEKVDPYKLGFLKPDGSITERWIASAAIPRIDQNGDKLPETFGILLQSRPETRLSLVKTGTD